MGYADGMTTNYDMFLAPPRWAHSLGVRGKEVWLSNRPRLARALSWLPRPWVTVGWWQGGVAGDFVRGKFS